jgi:tRNA-uridine 2-sulfurtransferase
MKSQGTPTQSQIRKKKVFVGMSGGVDSSVSAALLKSAGYDVTGVFIKVWQPDWITCTWQEERHEAMRAAACLDIPFVTLDLEKEYKQYVIDYMIAEYTRGRTPNPDIMCNREVKFGAFWYWAQSQAADCVATGHYARVRKEQCASIPKNFLPNTATDLPSNTISTSYKLLAGVDTNKDQSYFLWTLGQADLAHILFPVGDMTKPEVRALARKYKLPNAEKKDSQGLCFIGKIDVKDFLSHYIESVPGNLLNTKGHVIGTHQGSLLMTIGERRGFTIDPTEKTPHDSPYYVVAKNIRDNTVTVSNKKEDASEGGVLSLPPSISVGEVRWTDIPAQVGDRLDIRVRYRQVLTGAVVQSIDTEKHTLLLQPETPVDAVTSGQSLVMYRGEECIGGGVIV